MDWRVNVFNKSGTIVDSWTICNRTEDEAAQEAVVDVEKVDGYTDWSLVPEREPIKVIAIPLQEDDLLYPASWIAKIGGPENARVLLLDILDRYFNDEYIDQTEE